MSAQRGRTNFGFADHAVLGYQYLKAIERNGRPHLRADSTNKHLDHLTGEGAFYRRSSLNLELFLLSEPTLGKRQRQPGHRYSLDSNPDSHVSPSAFRLIPNASLFLHKHHR